jgi:hypothetical protein
MIERDPRFKTYPGVSMEAARVAVTSEQMDNFFQEAFRIIESVPTHFIFHMDEMGHLEWSDRKAMMCGVPRVHEGDHVNFPVARTAKRRTLMACIVLDDSFLNPMVIVPRKTVDNDLILTGLTSEKGAAKSDPHGFINASIFDCWMEATLIPELRKRREAFEYMGPAVILIDKGCHSHGTVSADNVVRRLGSSYTPVIPTSRVSLKV